MSSILFPPRCVNRPQRRLFGKRIWEQTALISQFTLFDHMQCVFGDIKVLYLMPDLFMFITAHSASPRDNMYCGP